LIPDDGPELLRALVESLKSKYAIDTRAVYLFGHSAGAIFALQIACLESEYFAATAIHAGALAPRDYAVLDLAKRKIPVAIFVGTKDHLFPRDAVRATRDLFSRKGFPVELTEIPDHDHWYYDLAPKINAAAWEFLTRYRVEQPRYQEHRFGK
jgi:predicted esterase